MKTTYLLIYLISTLLAIIVTPLVIRLARRFNILDIPDIRRVHNRPIPRIGGTAIFTPFIIVNLYILLFPAHFGMSLFDDQYNKIILLLSSSAFIFIVGLIDDIKGLRARVKLLCQFLASVIICLFGFRINSVALSDNFVVNLGLVSWPVTIIWIIGITNAVNLIDGLDGLAAGLSSIACGVMVILSILFQQYIMAAMFLALLGSLTGFLFFNFNPAKTFMGDCGSLFLGFVIASSSVMCAAKSNAIISLTLPVLALGIPIFDTLSTILRRFLERRSLFSPDHDHFHHRLLALGLKQKHIVIIAYAITLLAAGFGMFMTITRSFSSIIIFACILTLLILTFRVVGLVTLRQTLTALKQKYIMKDLITHENEGFENARLYFCRAETFEQWWHSVCVAAENMNFINVLLPVPCRDGSSRLLSWTRQDIVTERKNIIKMTIPIIDRREGSLLELKVDINTTGSLESAGRRARLFNRLIDEHCLSKLSMVKNEQLNPLTVVS